MTGFRGKRGARGGRGGRDRGRFNGRNGGPQSREVYKGDNANDFPATIALIEVGSSQREPRHRYTFKDDTMTLQFQEKTLSVHGCADYEEGKRVTADMMLKQIYPNHTLAASTVTFKDAHEFTSDADAWKEVLVKYNANRQQKRLDFLKEMQEETTYTDEVKEQKIATYEKNYAVQPKPEYDELCKSYLDRREKRRNATKVKRENNSNKRMSDGSDKESGSEREATTEESEDDDDPDRETYRRIVEMLADVSRVQNIPYPEYSFKHEEDQSVLTLHFQKTVITMKKERAKRVNMRGVISDLMLKDLYAEHEVYETTQNFIDACEKSTSDVDWDAKVAQCRKDNEERVQEKIKVLEGRKFTDEVKAEIRARYQLWLEDRPQPTYEELCKRVDDRLARIDAKRANRKTNRNRGGDRGGERNASGDGQANNKAAGRSRGGRRGFRGGFRGKRSGFRGNFRGRNNRGKKVQKTQAAGEGAQEVKVEN